jgi:hypothetical protein
MFEAVILNAVKVGGITSFVLFISDKVRLL